MFQQGEDEMDEEQTKAEGYVYDPATRDWTKRVEYVARSRSEALDWMKFNRDWMKNLRIVEE